MPLQNHGNSTRAYRINVIGRINDASSLVLSRHEGKKLEVISKCIFLEENQVNWIISSVNDNEVRFILIILTRFLSPFRKILFLSKNLFYNNPQSPRTWNQKIFTCLVQQVKKLRNFIHQR